MKSHHYCQDEDKDEEVGGEVVGSRGRMGSFVLRTNPNLIAHHNNNNHHKAMIGSLSKKGTPIYACVPATAFQDIIQRTLPDRINDLVWVCNGLPLDMQLPNNHSNPTTTTNMTYCVLHFAVLTTMDVPNITQKNPPPDTVLFGTHATTFANTILHPHSIPTHIVSSLQQIQTYAIYKLLWVSSMWLLCHSSSSTSITVQQVHNNNNTQHILNQLLQNEFIPMIQSNPQLQINNNNNNNNNNMDDIMSYLRQYSFSMPNHTIPSKELALKEFQDRNGKLFSPNATLQPIHHQLLQNVTNGTDYYTNWIMQYSKPQQH